MSKKKQSAFFRQKPICDIFYGFCCILNVLNMLRDTVEVGFCLKNARRFFGHLSTRVSNNYRKTWF